jgi:hypothetical protein
MASKDHRRMRITEVGVVADIAIAALAMQVGCPPDRIDELWNHLRHYPPPRTAQAAAILLRDVVAGLPPRE